MSVEVAVKELEEINEVKGVKCKGGIYQIRNTLNNKVYVGSTIDLNKRKRQHFNNLKGNKHSNKHLQSSYNKYNYGNFIFEIIEYVEDKNKLLEREQYWIDKLNVCDDNYGYNISPTAGNCLGVKASEETKKKMSKKNKGSGNPFYGKKHTDETKEKISNIRKEYCGDKHPLYGKHHTIESREKMSKTKKELGLKGEKCYMWGKHPSEETRRKQSESRIGKSPSEETRKKISEAKKGDKSPNYGKHLSEETKQKLSQSLKIKGLSIGEKNYFAKLTNNEVVEIKILLKENNLTQKEIADKFYVTNQAITKIKTGRTWSHIKLEDYLDENGNIKEIII